MSIVESARPNHSTRIARLQAVAGTALISAAIFAAAPKVVRAELDYIGTGDQNWFNTANWASGTTTGSLPESFSAPIGDIDAQNTSMPNVGVLFDPANQGMGATYIANLNQRLTSFYVTATGGSPDGSSGFPNRLTVESGTFVVSTTSIGRDGPGIVTQNGGTWIGNGGMKIGGDNKTSQGAGTYEYHGGIFTQNNQIQLGASNGSNDPATNSAAVGKFVVYNDGPDGHLLVSNGFSIATNGNGGGAIGIVEFHYDLNTHGLGNVRPIQNNGFNAGLSLKNSDFTGTPSVAGQSSRLNLVLDTFPQVGGVNVKPDLTNTSGVYNPNLGLFKDGKQITGTGTYPKAFYSFDGGTLYSQGATITAAYLGFDYSWTISYSGLITFTDSATSAYGTNNIAATGGNDVVLLGITQVVVPEPGAMALLGGAGSLILARRRQKTRA